MLRFITALILFSTFMFAAHAATHFNLASPSFITQNNLPKQFTCDGKNISPALHWTNVPSQTKSLALILSDPDAPNGIFYHWILYHIPVTQFDLSEGITIYPQGIKVGKNSWSKLSYNGPCPPKGQLHHYIFTLYAIDMQLDFSQAVDAKTLLSALQNHIIESTTLATTYQRTA